MNSAYPEPGAMAIADVFVWDSQLETGIEEIDQQHRELVRLINMIGRMQVKGHSLDSFSRELLNVFDELASYVEYHFGFEETFMSRYFKDKDHCTTHRQGHADFSARIAEAKAAALEYPSSVAWRMLTFLSRWLLSHIIGADMHMARKIQAIQTGMCEEDATHAAEMTTGNINAYLLASMERLYECLSRRTHDLIELKYRYDQEIKKRRRAEDELRKH